VTLKYFNVKNGLSTGNVYLHAGNSNVVAHTFIGNVSVTNNANLGNAATANFFIGDGSLLTNLPGMEFSNLANFANSSNLANLANFANSANISELSNIANIVSASSQPNITSVGNLVTLTVDGAVNLGAVANVHITGGSNGYILQTDGTGNLSWVVNSGSASLQLPDVSVDNFTADGSNNSFELSTTPDNKDYLIINIDGVLQLSDSYTLTGNAVAFGSTPLEDSLIEIKTLVPGAGGGSGASANTIFNGDSNVKVYASSNVAISSNGTANMVVVSSSDITIAGNLLPNANVTYDIGSPSNSFRDLYLSGSTIYFGGATIKADAITGAIALIPQPTANTPNPTGIVISSAGSISTIVTNAGNISNADFSNVVANTPSYASITYVDDSVANIVNSAPAALNTLNELANALGNDASFSTTVTNTLANKLNSNAFTYANISGAPTLGNISTININGNASTILYGNGAFATAPVTYANSNVATYLPTYTGNLSPGNITIAPGNLKISGGTANYVLKTDGTGNLSWTAQSGGSSTQSFVKEYVFRGGLTENTGTLRHYIHTTSTLTGIYAYVVSAGLSQSTVVVKKNGTAINTITIPANSTNVNQSGLSISLATADYLTVDITQSSSASDLYINFVYQG